MKVPVINLIFRHLHYAYINLFAITLCFCNKHSSGNSEILATFAVKDEDADVVSLRTGGIKPSLN